MYQPRGGAAVFSFLGFAAANLIYLILHVTNSGSFPRPLSATEERHYLTLLKEGDPTARNVLIERNLRLVAHIIKKYCHKRIDFFRSYSTGIFSPILR